MASAGTVFLSVIFILMVLANIYRLIRIERTTDGWLNLYMMAVCTASICYLISGNTANESTGLITGE